MIGISILLILCTSWIMGNLLLITPEKTGTAKWGPGEEGEPAGAGGFWIPKDVMYNAWYVILAVMIGITLIFLPLTSSDNIKVQLAAGVGAIILYIILGFSAITGASIMPNIWGGEGLGQGLFWKTGEGGAVSAKGGLGIMALMILTLTIVTIVAVQRFRGREEEEEEEEELEEQFSRTIDRTIEDLHEGEDVRSTVIQCYQKMCYFLEMEGIDIEENLTPREFKNKTTNLLPITKKTISDLTYTFEEARYSSHQLGNSTREKALNDLKVLRGELEEGENGQ